MARNKDFSKMLRNFMLQVPELTDVFTGGFYRFKPLEESEDPIINFDYEAEYLSDYSQLMNVDLACFHNSMTALDNIVVQLPDIFEGFAEFEGNEVLWNYAPGPKSKIIKPPTAKMYLQIWNFSIKLMND